MTEEQKEIFDKIEKTFKRQEESFKKLDQHMGEAKKMMSHINIASQVLHTNTQQS